MFMPQVSHGVWCASVS